LNRLPNKNRSTAIQLWVIGALIPVALFFVGDPRTRDFTILWAAAAQLLSGNEIAIYQPDLTNILVDGLARGHAAVFPYPPHALFFILPFGLLPYFPAFLVWSAASLFLFSWAARPYFPSGLPPILAVLTPASLICLDFGQTGLLLGALWLFAFRGKWAAVALLTFKPHLGFLSILSIRTLANLVRIALFVLALIGASAMLFGHNLWPEFIHQATSHGSKIGSVKGWLFAGVSPAMGYGFWGWIPFATAAALLLARNVNVFTASTASFLISPFGFHYDMTVTSLGFGLTIARNWHVMPVRDRTPIAIGFLCPVVAIGGVWWVPPLLLWALWAQVKYEARAVNLDTAP
jgi:hypothetical protein